MKDVIKKYIESAQQDENHRYKSWEHCYNAFANFDNSDDYLALHLAFYLASWGMYRGSSGLLWKDYKVHIDAVKILKKYRYQRTSLNNNLLEAELLDVTKELKKYYSGISYINGKNYKAQITATDTLISKIILGTLGSLPALDRYFNIGFRKEYPKTESRINSECLEKIRQFAQYNEPDIANVQDWIKSETGEFYPLMKIIDMYFWQIGYDIAEQIKNGKNGK